MEALATNVQLIYLIMR